METIEFLKDFIQIFSIEESIKLIREMEILDKNPKLFEELLYKFPEIKQIFKEELIKN